MNRCNFYVKSLSHTQTLSQHPLKSVNTKCILYSTLQRTSTRYSATNGGEKSVALYQGLKVTSTVIFGLIYS
jgi:hypothetical protein